jgi:hypothetical protein
MAASTPTLYEVLGLRPDARHTDIGLAYNRLVAAQRRDDVAPDLQRVAKLKEAFEVLSDLDRRAAYDAQLRAARIRPAFRKGQGLVAAGFLVLVGAALYWHLRPGEAPAAPGESYDALVGMAIPAVGRLKAVEMSGEVRPAGLAVAVEEGVFITSCASISPTAQLSVELAPRSIPARVTMADPALGLCKLEVPGAGSWPLGVADGPPKAGERAYAAQIDTKGEVGLREVRVKNLATRDDAALVVTNVAPDHSGAPLIDIHGRVVAIARLGADGRGAYVPIPKSWGDPPPKAASPAAPAPAPEPVAEGPGGSAANAPGGVIDPAIADLQPKAKMPSYVTPEQKARLEKAFRPPPNVPDDI